MVWMLLALSCSFVIAVKAARSYWESGAEDDEPWEDRQW